MKTTFWNRRDFMKAAGTLGISAMAGPQLLLGSKTGQAAGPKLRIAVIGVGAVTFVHYPWVKESGHMVTLLCDVDQRRLDPVNPMLQNPQDSFPAGFPNARRVGDYREVFAQFADEFDAVLCASTDHHHYGICELALKHGKSIYCEKPICWSPEEGFRLGLLAAEAKVATQMGNQGNSSNGWKFGDGYYRQGNLGEIVEVHGWTYTNFPLAEGPRPRFTNRPDPVPDYLDWPAWLGPAGDYPFMQVGVHPGAWREWIPFGGGQIGDWGCHVFGGIFKTLDHLQFPSRVEVVKMSEFNGETYPSSMTVKWEFPESHGRSAVNMYFHTSFGDDPDFYPPRPEELEADREWPPSRDGCYWVGTEGTYVMHEGHNALGALVPEARRRELGKPQLHFPLTRGNNFKVHGENWLKAATAQVEWDDTMSNFDYGSRLSTIVQMGNAALRAGKALDINPKTGWPIREEDRACFCRQNANKAWYTL